MSWLVLGLLWCVAAPAVGTSPEGAREPEQTHPEPADGLAIRSPLVSHDAVARGLDARVSEPWRTYAIEVVAGPDDASVDVTVARGAGPVQARRLRLAGQTIDERSRELASALALIIEQLPAADGSSPTRPDPDPQTQPAGWGAPRGWVGLGPRIGFNAARPSHVDGGLGLAGGAWLVRDHLQPLAVLEWSRSVNRPLIVDAVRVGAGLLAGSSVGAGRLWLGGGGSIRAQWARAKAERTVSSWWTSPSALLSAQYRARVLLLGLWTGVDFVFPALRARSNGGSIGWARVRPFVMAHVGVRLPLRHNSERAPAAEASVRPGLE